MSRVSVNREGTAIVVLLVGVDEVCLECLLYHETSLLLHPQELHVAEEGSVLHHNELGLEVRLTLMDVVLRGQFSVLTE